MLDSPHHRSQLARSTVLIQVEDSAGHALAQGTGCLVVVEARSLLITCWHLVTGIDFISRQIPFDFLPHRRRYLRIFLQDVRYADPLIGRDSGIIIPQEALGVHIPLYEERDGELFPRWVQAPSFNEPERSELGNVQMPDHVDILAIDIPLNTMQVDTLCLGASYFQNELPLQGRAVSIIGYPNGLSLGGAGSAQPIWLTRFIASMRGDRRGRGFELRLDGSGFPGMSGAPVIYADQGQIRVIGFYVGSLTMTSLTHVNERLEAAQHLGLFIGVHTVSSTLGLPLTDPSNFTKSVP